MAGPTSALDAIKQIQTVLDDEKRSMTDGAHLRLSDAALAAFNEVKALARKKRNRDEGSSDVERGSEPASDSSSESGSDDGNVYGEYDSEVLEPHPEENLPISRLVRRWTRAMSDDETWDTDFSEMLTHLMGNTVINRVIGLHGLNHKMRLAAAMAIANVARRDLERPSPEGRLGRWMDLFVTEGALLLCVDILDNGERYSGTGIADAFDPRLAILDIFRSLCSFSSAFHQKLVAARAVETIQYMMRHSACARLRLGAQKVQEAMCIPDAPLVDLPRKRQERELETEELAKIWADQVREKVLHFYDLFGYADDLEKTDEQHVAAFDAIRSVLVRPGSPCVLETALGVVERSGGEAFVRTLRQGFHWNKGENAARDPRPAAMYALLSVIDKSSWDPRREIARRLENKNVRRFLRETTKVHDPRTTLLGKLCHQVALKLDHVDAD